MGVSLKLNLDSLKKRQIWKEKGYKLPQFDVQKVREKTLKEPVWIHFGAGNIFRAFLASLQQNLLNKGLSDKGIIACAPYDDEVIKKVYLPYENLSILVTLKEDGEIEKSVIASIVSALSVKENMDEIERIFISSSLQIASFTITEKGYALKNAKGEYFQEVLSDIDNFPEKPKSVMGTIAYLCYKRYLAGELPLALVSMDNIAHNGTKLYEAVKFFAEKWMEKGKVEKGFLDYLCDSKTISFPWSMIDKITPRPSEKVMDLLKADGLEDIEIYKTGKNTYVSCFVNAEPTEYLVIEDNFPNGRPPLEEAGVFFTDRETVEKAEKMKVCTCLNPLHTVLAIFGCLLNYSFIYEEMRDENLKALVEKIGYEEGLPTVINPGIINPEDFIKEVIEKRLPNPFVPDTPQRIACDTSQKIPVRFGETLKAYVRLNKDLKSLTYIPLFFAGWLRYLMGIDDKGKEFIPSPDPMLTELQRHIKKISLGEKGPFTEILKPILSDEKIFGINLYEYGLASKVEQMFEKLVSGVGAVRRTLKEFTELGVNGQ